MNIVTEVRLSLGRPAGWLTLISVLGVSLVGCAGSAVPGGAGSSPGDALNRAVDVTSMLASWRSGRCAATGRRWGGFSYHSLGMATPPPAPAGSRLTLVPSDVTRIMLCRFASGSEALSGSALLTQAGQVSELAGVLNSVTSAPDGGSCVGSGRVMILIGHEDYVAGLDMAIGGCPYLNSTNNVASYAGTSLLQIVSSDLSSK